MVRVIGLIWTIEDSKSKSQFIFKNLQRSFISTQKDKVFIKGRKEEKWNAWIYF